MQFAVYSQSKHVSQDQLKKACAALVQHNNATFCPKWGISPFEIVVVQDLDHVPPGYIPSGLTDSETEASALGWHDEKKGIPYVIDQVTAILDGGGGILDGGKAKVSLASVMGHEFDETACDQFVNNWTLMPNGLFLATETGDPVQATMIPVTLPDGTVVWVNNAVLPRYFDAQGPRLTKAKAASLKLYDIAGEITRPFQNRGYQILFDPSKIDSSDGPISNVWGDAAAADMAEENPFEGNDGQLALLMKIKHRKRSRLKKRLGMYAPPPTAK